METETTETDDVTVEITDNQPVNNNNISVIREWDDCIRGKENMSKDYKRHRRIQKIPPLLLEGDKGRRNREYYEPAVVSLGPYHYRRAHLAEAEEYKLITLEEYSSSTRETIDTLYNRVFEVVHDARKCYIDGSTHAYNDDEFNLMMLRDGCFVLFFIECVSVGSSRLLLNNEYLGALGFANVIHDIFLLENQIPFVVLEVLLTLKFPDDKGEDILNGFFNYLKYGEVVIMDEKVLGNKQPLHLLELYRSYFITLPISLGPGSTNISKYVKQNRVFPSATELKSQWIFLRSISDDDIAFHSHCCYGVLELPRRAIFSGTKAIYLNMIAYESCAHNPNDFRVSTYVRIMKSLIIQHDDVKELKKKGILIHNLGRDEHVVKMYDEFEVPACNFYFFDQFLLVFENHLDRKYKTWTGELITDYFSSPWKTVALLAAIAVLFTSFLQTYFAAKQLPDR
ncbi:hypothetical protein HanPSC8_Chr06g0248821 [Helianthus annuus]|nr:hypothetical protein HanIR_Chr06g0277301 [Helianthus annuus]KAJ0566773.1 hypothetical protein HanIR_Chr06g0277351 [Helianthus annuus]KAJ0915344.1 hypothetical protein HanPSC8_Chr06g0248801 [Helianthus annuus]KAJ0915346.1 hypothetical protein HanPSC8_Chr06g0248821 [Helianthus annuus]